MTKTGAAPRGTGADRVAGGTLIAAAALSVLAMAHHPAGAHGGGDMAGFIHGVMIVLLTATAYGFAHFALRRGVARPPILAGLIAYLVSLVAHLGAATINGFIVPALVARGVANHELFLFAWEANQALAGLGVFATGAAYLLWSIDFLHRPGFGAKAIGAAGLVAGLLPAALLASGAIRMNVGGALLAYALFAWWGVLIGLHLIRGKVRDEPVG